MSRKAEIATAIGLGVTLALFRPEQSTIEDYPIATQDPEVGPSLPSYIIPREEITSLRSIDMPTFPTSYTPGEFVQLNKVSENMEIISFTANQTESDAYLTVIISGPPKQETNSNDQNEPFHMQHFLNKKTGSVTLEWNYEGYKYAIIGSDLDDVVQTIRTFEAFSKPSRLIDR